MDAEIDRHQQCGKTWWGDQGIEQEVNSVYSHVAAVGIIFTLGRHKYSLAVTHEVE